MWNLVKLGDPQSAIECNGLQETLYAFQVLPQAGFRLRSDAASRAVQKDPKDRMSNF